MIGTFDLRPANTRKIDRKLHMARKADVQIQQGADAVLATLPSLQPMVRDVEGYLKFSLLCSVEGSFKLANLPIPTQMEAYKLYQTLKDDPRFWKLLKTHKQVGLKALLLNHQAVESGELILNLSDNPRAHDVMRVASGIMDAVTSFEDMHSYRASAQLRTQAHDAKKVILAHAFTLLSFYDPNATNENSLSKSSTIELGIFLKNVEEMYRSLKTTQESHAITEVLGAARTLSTIRNPELRARFFTGIADYVYDNQSDYTYTILNGYIAPKSAVDEIMLALSLVPTAPADMVKYLSTLDNDKKVRTLLGISIDRFGYSRIINNLRTSIHAAGRDKQQINRLERIGKMLLGFEPDDATHTFHTSLDSFYRAVDLDNLPHLQDATDHDRDLIDDIIHKYGFQHVKKIMMGCGKGRIERHFTSEGQTGWIGVDISPANIDAANANNPNSAIIYMQGDWNQLDQILPGEIGLIVNIGRNLHHEPDLDLAAEESARMLSKDGIILFDFADSSTGAYIKFRERMLDILESLSIPLIETCGDRNAALEKIEFVVDTPFPNDPSKTDWIDRYVPSASTISQKLKIAGLTHIIELDRVEIPGWDGAQNVYYIARKE